MNAPSKSVLIAEDDEAIAAGLALNLSIEGYQATCVQDGQAALDFIRSTPPALVVLDIGLPQKNGLEVLSDMRAEGNKTPVLILSARQDEFDKVAALRLGADDYVTKPFALAELLARIAAVLRRTQASERTPEPATAANSYAFDKVVVDMDTRVVTRSGQSVAFTHLEFELLAYFLRKQAQVVSREQLLKDVWGQNHSGSARTVDNFVKQLRAKLESDPEAPRHFVTVRGSGYRFDP